MVSKTCRPRGAEVVEQAIGGSGVLGAEVDRGLGPVGGGRRDGPPADLVD